jgi:hypothetical protein
MNYPAAIAAKRAQLQRLRESHRELREIYAQIERSVEPQPLLLKKREAKADPRRFTAEPLTGFGAFA